MKKSLFLFFLSFLYWNIQIACPCYKTFDKNDKRPFFVQYREQEKLNNNAALYQVKQEMPSHVNKETKIVIKNR